MSTKEFDHEEYLKQTRTLINARKQLIVPMYQKKPTATELSKQDQNFKDACELADIQPTVRQARKWRNKKGKAYFTWRQVNK